MIEALGSASALPHVVLLSANFRNTGRGLDSDLIISEVVGDWV